MILDTCFVEDVARGDPVTLATANRLASEDVPERLSVVTLYELYWGLGFVEKADDERNRIDAVLVTKELYEVTPEIARKAGRVSGTLETGDPPTSDPTDELIGATGVVHDEPVLTRNTDTFERIPGLEVETY